MFFPGKIVFWLAISSLVASQNLYAHNEDSGIEKRVTEREDAVKQEDRKTWDDFMNAVKEQETKENTGDDSKHKNHSGE